MEFLDWWYGLLGLSIPTAAIYILVTTHVTFIAITVYLHRFSAHRAMTMHPALQHVMRFWVWFTTGMGTKSWTAVHRKHHALTETEGDPHSPKVKGLWTILFKGVEAYRDAITPDTLEKYGKGTPDDWLENNIYDQDKLGVGMLLVIDLLLFGSVGLVVWGIQMIWVPFFAAGVINGVGHAIGYRNFECPDASKNIVPIAFFICGEELHNNHHTYPNSPKLSVKKWEFDLGWGYIKLFEFFGLCKPNKVGPVIEKDKTKSAIDFDTLRALANDRFAVMSKFANQVVSPVVSSLSSENGNSRKLLQKAKRAICRDPIVMDQKMSQYQEQLFKQFPVLAEIYRHKEELLKVWSKRTGRKEELLKAFGNWCEASEKIAERWRLEHLSKFVDELKSYSVPKLTSA
ncbi:MAG: fatty acid desaturase [Gammaproteobacteria bacterium]|nr:fatty acid desaturase [Gammaproteobacteria bacterium]